MSEKPVVEVSYGPVRLVEPAGAAPRPPPFWQRSGAALTFLRTLIVDLAVIAALVALAALTVNELRRKPVIIEEIGLPPQLTARGYSGAVAAQRLWDAMVQIQATSGTIKEHPALTTIGRQIQVVEPGTGLSLQGLTQMLRAVLGLPETRIGGEVICESAACDWTGLSLRLRIFTEAGMQVRDLGLVGGHGTGDYFHRAAIEAMRVVDPYALAAYYYGSDKTTSRLIASELVRTSHPHRAWASHLLGNLDLAEGRHQDAIIRYQLSIGFAEADGLRRFALPWNGWGDALGELGRHEEALEKYRRATEVDPDMAGPWNGWGNSLYALGRHEESFEKYRRATELDPADPFPWGNWGISLAFLDRHEEALGKYQRAAELDPDFVAVWYPWGYSLAEVGRHEEAIGKYQRATELDPENSVPWNGWGNSLHALGRHEEAIAKYRRATELDPRNPFAWYNWGNGLGALGRHGEALEKYRQATEVAPDYASAWNNWGNSLGELGRYEDAFDKYAQALAADPPFAAAAGNWGDDLARYIDAEPGERCARALALGPRFLDVAGPFPEGDEGRGQVADAIAACEAGPMSQGHDP